jgi:uncharacterized protein YndB with AHSA1/START domain
MAAKSNMAPESAERELIITRVFDAPRALVFKAWTDADSQARWLGPKGFTTISCEIDARPGRRYRLGMRAPDGTAHWLCGVCREIVEPQRIVSTSAWEGPDGNPGPETLLTLTFDDLGGKTRLTLRQSGFESVTVRDEHRAGWTSNLDRLADYLASA